MWMTSISYNWNKIVLLYFQLNVLNDVIHAVINSEPVIFSSNNWRLQEYLMDNISCLIKCCSSDVLYHKVIPVVYPRIKTAVSIIIGY